MDLFNESRGQVDSTGTGNNASYTYDASTGNWTFISANTIDPLILTQLRAYLEAGETYTMHLSLADTNGVENAFTGSIQVFYAISGAYNEPESFRLTGSGSATFTANATGTYYFRIDDDISLQTFKVYDVYLYHTTSNASTTIALHQGWYYQLPILSRVGYTFNGWQTNDSTSTITGNMLCVGSTDATVTAQWVPNQYSVVLNQEGGSSGTDRVIATYDSVLPDIVVQIV